MATFTGGLELALATLQTVTNTDFSGRVRFYYFFFSRRGPKGFNIKGTRTRALAESRAKLLNLVFIRKCFIH